MKIGHHVHTLNSGTWLGWPSSSRCWDRTGPPFTPLTCWRHHSGGRATTSGRWQHLQDRGTNYFGGQNEGATSPSTSLAPTLKTPFIEQTTQVYQLGFHWDAVWKQAWVHLWCEHQQLQASGSACPTSFFFTQSAGKYHSVSESKASAGGTTAKSSQTQQHHSKVILSCLIFLCFIALIAYLYFAFTVFRVEKTLLDNKLIQITFIFR